MVLKPRDGVVETLLPQTHAVEMRRIGMVVIMHPENRRPVAPAIRLMRNHHRFARGQGAERFIHDSHWILHAVEY